jgi:Tfp pilus assembly protein PilZ
MDRLKHLKTRKDARLYFNKNQPISVRCLTGTCNFEATIQDVSSSGIFISTHQDLQVGEEIAIKFTFPESGNKVQATGEVVRTTDSGIGIEVKVYFQDKRKRYKSRLPGLVDNSQFIS